MEGKNYDGGDFKAVIMDSSNSLSKTLRFNYVLLSSLAIKMLLMVVEGKYWEKFYYFCKGNENKLKLRQFKVFN